MSEAAQPGTGGDGRRVAAHASQAPGWLTPAEDCSRPLSATHSVAEGLTDMTSNGSTSRRAPWLDRRAALQSPLSDARSALAEPPPSRSTRRGDPARRR